MTNDWISYSFTYLNSPPPFIIGMRGWFSAGLGLGLWALLRLSGWVFTARCTWSQDRVDITGQNSWRRKVTYTFCDRISFKVQLRFDLTFNSSKFLICDGSRIYYLCNYWDTSYMSCSAYTMLATPLWSILKPFEFIVLLLSILVPVSFCGLVGGDDDVRSGGMLATPLIRWRTSSVS